MTIFNLTALGAYFGERQAQRVGQIVGATLGGLLSAPIMAMLSAAVTSVFVGRGSGHITSREITQEVVQICLDSISEPMAGLSAALAGGMTILLRSPAGIDMEFGESLRSGLIAATAAGIGATLSTTLMRRALADCLPIPANLEDVATEQPNMQGQNI